MKKLLILLLTLIILSSCGNQDNNTQQVDGTIHSNKANTNEVVGSYVLNQDYHALAKTYDTGNKEQVVVYEFFSYACRHCFTFEPFINKWLEIKPDYVKFVRVPLNFNPSWANLQQAFLTAQAMGIAEESHTKLFNAIHKENKRFNTLEDLARWYAKEAGINKDDFISTSESFILDSNMRQADKMGAQMQISSTPTLIINGKYFASKKKHARDEIMKILDFLIEKEADSMGLLAD